MVLGLPPARDPELGGDLQAVLTEARFWESDSGKPFNGLQRLLLNR